MPLTARTILLGVVATAVLVAASPAAADQWGDIDCRQLPNHPQCEVEANAPGNRSVEVGPEGETVCRYAGEVVPCVDDDGWLGADGCRYQRIDSSESPPAGAATPGGWYLPTCPGDPPGSQRPGVWLSDAEAPGPAELAQRALSRLVLPQPALRLSPPPPAPQLVGLPTWLWVEDWGSRSTYAEVPGLRVTVTARPISTTWSTQAHGTIERCDGQGTPWRPGMDPAAPSPTCGYTFSGPFSDTLQATVEWQVSWQAGAASGTMPPLTSTASAPLLVVESRTRNITGGGS